MIMTEFWRIFYAHEAILKTRTPEMLTYYTRTAVHQNAAI